ncbi:MAG: LacI family DNA-binding transcriptional regulator [Victivallales bacterium]|nr:LacI family DNA-binding transcriptional regulator [Victivallales bacterium]
MKNGIQQIRLIDIAEKAGVSKVTVAKVLHKTGGSNTRVSKETAAKIHEIAAAFKYIPNNAARQLSGKKNNIIGLVIDSFAPPIHLAQVALMEQYAAQNGFKLMIGQAHNDTGRILAYARDFAAYRLDGIICMAHRYPHDASLIVSEFSSLLKTVFIGKPLAENKNLNYVSADIKDGMRQAVNDRLEEQCRNITALLIEGVYENIGMAERENGILEAFAINKLPADKTIISKVSLSAPLSPETIRPHLEYLVRTKKTDAIIASNDIMAAMIIRGLIRMGIKIPEEVKVIGYDNSDIAALMMPSITTFDQNNHLIAETAIDMLDGMINGKKIENHAIIKPSLIKRESA